MENNNATLPKLTVDIFNHPDCPGWAKWAAVDANGLGHVFDGKPDRGLLYWRGYYVNAIYIGDYDPTDWQNSLIERPEAERERNVVRKTTFDDGGYTAQSDEEHKQKEHDKSSLSKFGELLDKRKKSGWKNPAPEHDDVKAPSYYVNTPFGLEVRKITCHYDFNCGSALKYIIRHGKKVYGGMTAKESAIKDLGKAIECLQNEIEYIKENWEK